MDYSDYEFLKVEKADRVATLTLNRPDILNAVNSRIAPISRYGAFQTLLPLCGSSGIRRLGNPLPSG